MIRTSSTSLFECLPVRVAVSAWDAVMSFLLEISRDVYSRPDT